MAFIYLFFFRTLFFSWLNSCFKLDSWHQINHELYSYSRNYHTIKIVAVAVNAVFRKQAVYHCMHGGFVRMTLSSEHFSDLSRTGRLFTSLILQFAGWNSRPCSSLPPTNNGNPLSASYWPTTWLIKTGLQSRCQLTVKPIKPKSELHRKQSLAPWLWILLLVKGPTFARLRIRYGKCHVQYFNLGFQPRGKSIHISSCV